MKNLHTNKITMFGVFASSLLVAASAVYIYSPTFGSHAAESKEAEVSLTVASTLGLRTSADRLNLEANVGDFVHGAINVDVLTNSQYGYTLTLEDSDNESSLVHTNSSVEDKLTSFYAGAKTSSTMTDNTWGFSLNETDYYMIPNLGNPVALKRTTSAHSNYDTTSVGFGAKVGASLTAGTYTDTIKFTAYVNGADTPDDILDPGQTPETRTISDITTMQQMNSKICANSEEHETATLTDPRNGSSYSIAKLKDGKCWMTSNIDLDDYEITSADSDVPDGYSYQLVASSTDWSTPGGFRYDNSHVLITETGGMYTFYSAVAGWGLDENRSYVEAPQSICPKNWRLPTAVGDFRNMWTYYRPNWNAQELVHGVPNYILNYSNGTQAAYWSSSVATNQAQYMWLKDTGGTSDSVNPDGYSSVSAGYGVRCVAR